MDGTDTTPDPRLASRRTVLAVPGSSARMLAKARECGADEVFCDLEDAVTPSEKVEARATVVAALNAGGWRPGRRSVRVNAWSTPWTHEDLIAVVTGAGAHLDSVIVPKVRGAADVTATALLLDQLEVRCGLPRGCISVQAQIEDALALTRVTEIATASPRLEALVVGPGDMAADLGMRTLTTGEQPVGYTLGDAHHHVMMTVLVAARAHGLAAVDGPYLALDNPDGLRRIASASAAVGYDGKWVIHPGQIDTVNEVFTPPDSAVEAARELLGAHAAAADGARGAARHAGEMIDEASAAMARSVLARARAAGTDRGHRTFS
ncbi:HpcH/HpaI aldolase/citrate lyase family protein [Williamsia deligens]|uniref:HpcH/HpaI aldolase/citrate lyase family protein n=1 Tax=Williamsia deligens TaxID=321325 RepID=A0ABW3G9H8_9NOCA|nr:CoA ester lyase [Williamsia deligens]MCP2196222.1 citrate lyase subunit beta / citryl-CoA lyase [Williamsia deligens]